MLSWRKRQLACAVTEERQIACVIMEKRQLACAITEKRQISVVMEKNRYHVLSWKNTFVVPLFYKIVRRFYVVYISHRALGVIVSPFSFPYSFISF